MPHRPRAQTTSRGALEFLDERCGRLHHARWMHFERSSRAWLSPHDLPRFAGDTLFDHIARVVCEADCLPRKELFESWAVARRVRRRFRGGRVIDLACGHALTSSLLLLLDDTAPEAIAIDDKLPRSAERLVNALAERFPKLKSRVTLQQSWLDEVALRPSDVVVSVHACGALTDRVIERAVRAQARVAVLPCCHDQDTCDTGGLTPWMDVSLAIDATRVLRLREQGYMTHTQLIPADITPKNRLLLAAPKADLDREDPRAQPEAP